MQIIGLLFIVAGVVFSTIGVIGIVRLPDMYSRLHASGKVSTVGLCGILVGAAFFLPQATPKLIALALFAVLTLPVSSQAIAFAAYRHGLRPHATRDDLAQNRPSGDSKHS
jgi:multicomponent Na+:H+ antiporter subunit G